MPVLQTFALPESPSELEVHGGERVYICFIASDDAVTGEPWCSDVRAALPRVEKVFGGGGKDEKDDKDENEVRLIRVGGREEYASMFSFPLLIVKLCCSRHCLG